MFSMRNAFGGYPFEENELNKKTDCIVSDLYMKNKSEDQSDIEKAFARVFSTEDGQCVLSHLQSITFQRALGPEASDTQLRYLEGQRAMIATIMKLIRSGRT